MTVHFANSGELDLSLLTLMGVSIKQSRSPIGFFGTGMKFGLATLLRTGHRVRLWTGGRWHSFSATSRQIRGETVDVVCMDGEALPFALTLGRNWEPWQAYRELASNARDEPGHVVTADPLRPESFDTCWVVEGEGIEAAHRDRDTIFCASRVLHHLPGIAEVREGRSQHIFYRGVRIWTMPKPSLWTWNLLSSIELTEDRTMKYESAPNWPLGRLVAQSEDEELVSSVVSARDGVLEESADFSYCGGSSPTFQRVVARLGREGRASHTAVRLWSQTAPVADVYEDAVLDDEDHRMIEEAEDLCLAIDPDYAAEPRFVVAIADSIYGRFDRGTIVISHAAISMGVDFLAATMMEEYLHQQHGFIDCDRPLQNYLFQQLVRLARRIP